MTRYDPISQMWEIYLNDKFVGLAFTQEDAEAYIKIHTPQRIPNDTETT